MISDPFARPDWTAEAGLRVKAITPSNFAGRRGTLQRGLDVVKTPTGPAYLVSVKFDGERDPRWKGAGLLRPVRRKK